MMIKRRFDSFFQLIFNTDGTLCWLGICVSALETLPPHLLYHAMGAKLEHMLGLPSALAGVARPVNAYAREWARNSSLY